MLIQERIWGIITKSIGPYCCEITKDTCDVLVSERIYIGADMVVHHKHVVSYFTGINASWRTVFYCIKPRCDPQPGIRGITILVDTNDCSTMSIGGSFFVSMYGCCYSK